MLRIYHFHLLLRLSLHFDGSGGLWKDGSLHYDVAVSGNEFARTGGNEGEVTGAFFGSGHEAMGGVLRRLDLSAGFVGKL